MIYVMFFAFVQAIYPAVFSLYPAMERSRKVRALEYANGVGRGAIWVAYGMFDFMWVLLISAGVTLLLSTRNLNGSPGVMFCVLALYGLTGVFTGYIISHFTRGPLKTFITTFALSIVFYAVSLLALVVSFCPGFCTTTVSTQSLLTLCRLVPKKQTRRSMMRPAWASHSVST